MRTLPFLFILLIAFSSFFSCRKGDSQSIPNQDTTKPQDTIKPADSTKSADTARPLVILTPAERVRQITQGLVGRNFLLSYFGTRYHSEPGISSTYHVYNDETFSRDTLIISKNRYNPGLVITMTRYSNLIQVIDSILFIPKIYISANQDSFVGLICNSDGHDYRGGHFGAYHKGDTIKPASTFADYHNYYRDNTDPLLASGPTFEIQYYFKKDSIAFLLKNNLISYTEGGSLVEKRGQYFVMYGRGI